MNFIENNDEQRLYLDDGTYLYLAQRNIPLLSSGLNIQDYKNNIFKMTNHDEQLWRISGNDEYKFTDFTQLFVNENPRLVYNSSGFRCLVNLETGVAETQDYPLLGPWKKRPLLSGFPATRFIEIQSEQRVYLDDGTYLFLAQRNIALRYTGLSPEDYARNVFRMTESGEILWTIKTDRDSFGSPFIELFLDEDSRKMANWDGLMYCVDLETGETESYAYSR